MDSDMNEQPLPALSEHELAQLRIKISKSHRTQKDWAFIRELLQNRMVFTAEPVNEPYRTQYSIEGTLFDGKTLLAFSSVEACENYLVKYGSAGYGYQLTIGEIPFSTVIGIAIEHRKKMVFDGNYPQSGAVLGFDGEERTLRILKQKS